MPYLTRVMDWVNTHPAEIRAIVDKVVNTAVAALELAGKAVGFLVEHANLHLAILIGSALNSAIQSVIGLGESFIALAAKIGTATTAQLAFNAAKAAGLGGGIGGAIGLATTGGVGGGVGGTIGGVLGGVLGNALLPGIGGILGSAVLGYVGGKIGRAIEGSSVTPTVNVAAHFHLDEEKASSHTAQKLIPVMKQAKDEMTLKYEHAAHHGAVAAAAGARRR